MKKLLITALSSILFLSLTSIPANGEDIYKENEKAGIAIAEYLEEINAIKSSYRPMSANQYDDSYAGAWIDKDNKPHIAFTNNQKIVSRKATNIEIEYFKNSLNDLLELQETIIAQSNLNIVSTAVLEDKNALKIGYYSESDFEYIKSNINKLNTKNISIIYEQVDLPQEDAIYGGAKVTASGQGSCSVGFGARLNGNYGFVTAGHCFTNNTQTNLGKVTKVVYGGKTNMDAEFIQSGMISRTDVSGYSYSSVGEYGVYQGSIVRINTYIQKSSGAVQSMFASASFGDGQTLSNLILHNAYRVGGMSGGVAISGSQAIGIHIGGSGEVASTGYIVKGSAVFSSLGLTN